MVVPISFVSEHSETLVELDVDYRKLAGAHGVPGYYRVPALGKEEFFIDALADLCLNNDRDGQVRCFNKDCFCPRTFNKCICTA